MSESNLFPMMLGDPLKVTFPPALANIDGRPYEKGLEAFQYMSQENLSEVDSYRVIANFSVPGNLAYMEKPNDQLHLSNSIDQGEYVRVTVIALPAPKSALRNAKPKAPEMRFVLDLVGHELEDPLDIHGIMAFGMPHYFLHAACQAGIISPRVYYAAYERECKLKVEEEAGRVQRDMQSLKQSQDSLARAEDRLADVRGKING